MSASPPTTDESTTSTSPDGSWRDFARLPVLVLLAVVVLATLIGRFVVRSPLWLDEALSVNISKLPLGDIPDALRHDGHPPLYYVLLHGWMSLVGEGDRAVRALSGVITILTLPLAFAVGRRIGGRRLGITVALVFAVSPYAFRYGSETRMYALIIAEVFAGYLLVDAALERPRARTLVGIAAVAGLLLWTHYWAMWLLAATGVMVLARVVLARRRGDGDASGAALRVAGALVVGGLTFLPWLPTLLYQNEHTGTPWAESFRATTLVVTSITEFAGGGYSEAQVGMMILVLLVMIGVFGSAVDNRRIELDFFAHALSRRPLGVMALTIAVASAVGLLNGMAFAPRYAAVFFPFFVILVALGLEQFRGGVVRDVVLTLFALTALAGAFFVFRLERSQSREAADAIRAAAPVGVVVACPDQLGPSVARELRNDGYDVSTYPRFEAPELVDWVDYEERNAANDPARFAQELIDRAGAEPVFVVYRDDFLTLEGQCQRMVEALAGSRPPRTIVIGQAEDFYESMVVTEFAPPPR